jgi:cyanophycinase
VIQLHEAAEDSGARRYAAFSSVLSELGSIELVPFDLDEGDVLGSGQLGDLDALLVSGGLTPAYLTAVSLVSDEIKALVTSGAPYLGFSAGAAIASRRAIVGGWKYGDLVICDEDNGEELDELTIEDGLGLVDFAVDVHAAQWGNLGRPIMAVSAGLVERAVALDESTVWIVDGNGGSVPGVAQSDSVPAVGPTGSVRGVGQAWWIERAEGGVTVRMEREPAPELTELGE